MRIKLALQFGQFALGCCQFGQQWLLFLLQGNDLSLILLLARFVITLGQALFQYIQRPMALLVAPIVIIGVYPALLIDIFQPAVRLIVGGS